jgi:hypothetical protein
MSVLAMSELPSAERSNVVPMRRREPSEMARSLAMRDAVIARCKALNLGELQTQDALAAAEAERAFGGTAEQAVRAGWSKAERTAAQMKVIRTRFGTRPDPEPPRAA